MSEPPQSHETPAALPPSMDDRMMSAPKSLNADGVLAHMFRTIMFERGITFISLQSVVGRFLAKYEIPDTAISQDRKANLIKELKAASMTWRNFVRNIPLIGIARFELIVRAHGFDGRTTEHALMITPSAQESAEEIKK